MRSYVVAVDGELALLPAFVRHQIKLGADEFFLVTFGSRRDQQRAASIIGQNLVTNGPRFDTFTDELRHAAISEIHDGSWAYFCDMDEFPHVAPMRRAVKAGRPVVGVWIDRVSPRGLVEVDPLVPLSSQFPLRRCLADEAPMWRRL